jgi:hypothetical protein
MGVIDEEYVKKANDPGAVVGRKISVNREEVNSAIRIVEALGLRLFEGVLHPKPAEAAQQKFLTDDKQPPQIYHDEVSLSRTDRLADIQKALGLMLKALGPRAIDRLQFNPSEQPLNEIQNTTWLKLQRQYYVEPQHYLGGVLYTLTGAGWLAAIESLGELDDLKTRMAPLVAEMKGRVKGRSEVAFTYLDSIAGSAGVTDDFAYNVIESDAISNVLGRHGVRWEHPGKMIRIPEDFGLEAL